jgi:hypothetical protein
MRKAQILNHGSGTIFTSQTTPAPLLSIVSSNASLLLPWIVSSTNFVLQQNLDLTTSTWTEVADAPVSDLTNLREEVTLPLSDGRSFYRPAAQ